MVADGVMVVDGTAVVPGTMVVFKPAYMLLRQRV
jgi:hypothetical protein